MKGLDSFSVLSNLILHITDLLSVLLSLLRGLGDTGLDHIFSLELVLGGEFFILGADFVDHTHKIWARSGFNLDLNAVELILEFADFLNVHMKLLVIIDYAQKWLRFGINSPATLKVPPC